MHEDDDIKGLEGASDYAKKTAYAIRDYYDRQGNPAPEDDNSENDNVESEEKKGSGVGGFFGKISGGLGKLFKSSSNDDDEDDGDNEDDEDDEEGVSVGLNKIKFVKYGALAIGVVLIFLIMAISSLSMFFVSPFESGKGFSVYDGITGRDFYGVRLLYKNDELANNNMITTYNQFTYDLLYNVKEKAEEQLLLWDSFNNKKDFYIDKIVNNYLKIIINSENSAQENPEENLDGLTTLQLADKISYMGFKVDHIFNIILSVCNTLEENNLLYIPSGSDAGTQKAKLYNLMIENLSDESLNFKYILNVCDKIFIKDYILEENQMADHLPKENYIAYIYMAKKTVRIMNSSFLVMVEGQDTVNVAMMKVVNGTRGIIGDVSTIDSSWVNEESIENYYEQIGVNFELSPFTAIDTQNLNYLTEGYSIFDLLKNETYKTYFNETENHTQTDILNNVKMSDYLFFACDSDVSFYLSEYVTDFSVS